MKTTTELFEHYGSVIIPMCKGTALEDTTWLCMRLLNSKNRDTRYCSQHPDFRRMLETGWRVEFAVAILEDKPVFAGDVVYSTNGAKYTVNCVNDINSLVDIEHNSISYKAICISWNPPAPKRTFILNGVELPCPIRNKPFNPPILPYAIVVIGFTFDFDNIKDCTLVEKTILNILKEARDI